MDARIWNQIGLEPAGSCCLRTNETFLERDPYMQNNFGAINKANPRHSVMSTFNAPSKPGHLFGQVNVFIFYPGILYPYRY